MFRVFSPIVVIVGFTCSVHRLTSSLALARVLSEAQRHVFADVGPNIGRNGVAVAPLRKRIHLLELIRVRVVKSKSVPIAISIPRTTIYVCIRPKLWILKLNLG